MVYDFLDKILLLVVEQGLSSLTFCYRTRLISLGCLTDQLLALVSLFSIILLFITDHLNYPISDFKMNSHPKLGFWGFGVLGFWISRLFDLGDLSILENGSLKYFENGLKSMQIFQRLMGGMNHR